MVSFGNIKKIIALSKSKQYKEGVLTIELAMEREQYQFAFLCSESELIGPTYEFLYQGSLREQPFCDWSVLPASLRDGVVSTFFVKMDLEVIRQDIALFYDERELVDLRPEAPERFMIVSLSLNGGQCTLCPDEYNRNEILRYNQIPLIWRFLSSYADDIRGRELIFLYKGKISIDFEYDFESLSHEFDGLAKLEKIFSDRLHEDEKKNILKNTLHSFLWREKSSDRFKKILREFTLFSLNFEENYRAFSVGFSFDKIRKEYTERFRDYLSKLNSILYDTLTRSLSIPVSSIISFVAMKNNDGGSAVLINCAAIVLMLFTSISVYYLVSFQSNMVRITQEEYKSLFKAIRSELEELELSELSEKEKHLNVQSDKILKILYFIYMILISNFILNSVMFFISTF